jgi:hypothetical protein
MNIPEGSRGTEGVFEMLMKGGCQKKRSYPARH